MILPVLVINRAEDTERLSLFEASARQFGITATRIDALNAHRSEFPFALYSDLMRDRFWDSDQIKPGAIGCFLSHRRAWQHVVDHDLPTALICEDDADFRTDTQTLEHLASALPDFDVIFANERLSSWCRAAGNYDLKPLSQVLTDLAAIGGPKSQGQKQTPGADCYLISHVGAAALLDRTQEQGILCGVDWAMIWNGAGASASEAHQTFAELGVLAEHNIAPDPLKMFVIAQPVADQRPGRSVLKHAISVPISNLTQRECTLAHVESVSTVTIGTTQLCFACRSGPDPVMEAHRSGQIWDEPGLSALLKRLPERSVVVDVGAHSGNHSVVLAKLGGASRIIAIEPNAEIHRLLQTNMAINGVSEFLNLHPPGTALAGKPGKGWIIRNRKKSSETMVKTDAPADQQTPESAVDLITGDTLLGGEKIDAIKIDTSGSEVDVVKGLTQTLKLHKPLLLLDHGAHSQERIKRLADEISYRILCTVDSGRKNRVSTLLIAQ